jgi:hypothetical protein
MPLAKLGAERRVYMGRSLEGVLRRRSATQLAAIFRKSYVCIRRFRSTDRRLLPLVLDPPRLLKNHACPSELAVQVGLTRALPPPPPSSVVVATSDNAETSVGAAASSFLSAPPLQHGQSAGVAGGLQPSVSHEMECTDAAMSAERPAGAAMLARDRFCDDEVASSTDAPLGLAQPPKQLATEAAATPAAAEAAAEVAEGVDASEQAEYDEALARGVRLFSLYVAAGGALCMRNVVWRRLMPALHRTSPAARHSSSRA